MKHSFVLLLTVWLYTSCTPGGPLSRWQKEQVTTEVKAMLHAYNASVKKEGLLAEFNYLDSSDEFYWVPPGFSSYLDYDTISSILRQNAPVYATIENRWLELHIEPLSEESAMYAGTLRSVVTDTAGHKQAVTLREAGTVVKRADGWKLLNGQTTVAP